MKKAILVVLLLVTGCSKVTMTPQYRDEVIKSALIIEQLNQRCQEGDDTACRAGLAEANETMRLLVDAMYGEYNE